MNECSECILPRVSYLNVQTSSVVPYLIHNLGLGSDCIALRTSTIPTVSSMFTLGRNGNAEVERSMPEGWGATAKDVGERTVTVRRRGRRPAKAASRDAG